MNMEFMLSIAGSLAAVIIGYKIVMGLDVDVPEYHTALITHFGKIKQKLTRSGGYFYPSKFLPWVKVHQVSHQLRSEKYTEISIHDKMGTMMQVDLWVEYQVVDAEKALFNIENWQEALKSSVISTVSIDLTGLSLRELLKNASNLEVMVINELKQELKEWGIELHQIKIQKIKLTSDVQNQILQGISAHLEKKKSLILEDAKMQAALIDAGTEKEIAGIRAETSVQMAMTVAKTYDQLHKADPEVFEAYVKLYKLSLYNPSQTLIFEGFKDRVSADTAAFFIDQKKLRNA